MIVALVETPSDMKEELMRIQHYLFDCGNDLATPEKHDKYPYRTNADLVTWLESRIDEYAPLNFTLHAPLQDALSVGLLVCNKFRQLINMY